MGDKKQNENPSLTQLIGFFSLRVIDSGLAPWAVCAMFPSRLGMGSDAQAQFQGYSHSFAGNLGPSRPRMGWMVSSICGGSDFKVYSKRLSEKQ